MNEHQAKSLGALLSRRRQEAGLSKRQLAALTHMGNSTIVRLEQGQFAAPSPAKLSRLAMALHLPLADIFAMAGYFVPDELPSFEAYLLAKYPKLPARTRHQIVRHFEDITGISQDVTAHPKESKRDDTS
jgi:transcriptional regulator with XRE-family HTH domain